MIAPRRAGTPALSGYPNRSALRRAVAALASGGVVVLPTDTVYGFHCAASKRRAIETIVKLKGRPMGGGLILLAADAAMVQALVARWPGESRRMLARIWPAPLTAILPARRGVSRLLAPEGTIAVRIPARADLRALIETLREPVVSTSVNLSGRKPMRRIDEIRTAFPGLAGYLSRPGRSPALPSTIVDFTAGEPRLVRAGRYPWPASA
jgi:L-threonylcarbamoyladenylate synthase